jgi:hypothetical protein
MRTREIFSELMVLIFVMAMSVGILWGDRNMPSPPVRLGPAPKFVLINRTEKHEPKQVTVVTKT